MSDDLSSRLFEAGQAYTNMETFTASSKEVNTGAFRLEGAFYGSAGYRALKTMIRAGFAMTTVGQLAGVIWLGPFGRTYVDDPAHGVPFLSSSEMLEAKPDPKNYISKALTRNLDRLIVREGTILVSCSGTIGNVTLWTADLDGMAVSQHAIRVIPKDGLDRGLLYAFLLSEAGQFLVKRNKSGSVVESIYEADVSTLPIPLLPKALRRELTRLVDEACELRAKANGTLREAEEALWRQNYLECIPSVSDTETGFVSSRSALEAMLGETRQLRLDATFFRPEAIAIRDRIKKCPRWGTLDSLGAEVILLGKTFIPGVHKVERDWGIPYFTGKELIRTHLDANTFIASQKASHLDRLTVRRHMVLITCAGTVGRVAYVRGQLEGAAVTHDAIRVISPKGIAPGYVYAFLSSEAGQLQLQQCAYGSVIPRLHSQHIKSIVMPVPSDGGIAIGDRADVAHDYRTGAAVLEKEAIALFTSAIERGRAYIESEWGAEY